MYPSNVLNATNTKKNIIYHYNKSMSNTDYSLLVSQISTDRLTSLVKEVNKELQKRNKTNTAQKQEQKPIVQKNTNSSSVRIDSHGTNNIICSESGGYEIYIISQTTLRIRNVDLNANIYFIKDFFSKFGVCTYKPTGKKFTDRIDVIYNDANNLIDALKQIDSFFMGLVPDAAEQRRQYYNNLSLG